MCIQCDTRDAETCETHGHSPEWVLDLEIGEGAEECSNCGATASQMDADIARWAANAKADDDFLRIHAGFPAFA